MHLVALAQAAQDADRLLHGWLVDDHGLEAPLQRRVLLDVLAVLIERRRADRVELPAGEHGLEQVAGVHSAFRSPRADHRVELVDEEDDPPLAVLDLLEDRLQALLELAAVLRAGDERPEVQRDDALLFQRLRDVAAHDPLGQPFDDRRLADARLADQHRVVLRAAAQHLDDPPDLLVPADHRVELPRPRLLGQVPAVFLQRLVGALRGRRGDALAAPDASERAQHGLPARPVALQERLALTAGVDHAQQQMLRGHELVGQPARLLGRPLQHATRARVEGQLPAGDLRATGEERGKLSAERPEVHPDAAERLRGDALVVLDEGGEDVLRVEDGALEPLGQGLGTGDRFLRLLGETVQVHRDLGSFPSGDAGLVTPSVRTLITRRNAGRADRPRLRRRRQPGGRPRRARAGSPGPSRGDRRGPRP